VPPRPRPPWAGRTTAARRPPRPASARRTPAAGRSGRRATPPAHRPRSRHRRSWCPTRPAAPPRARRGPTGCHCPGTPRGSRTRGRAPARRPRSSPRAGRTRSPGRRSARARSQSDCSPLAGPSPQIQPAIGSADRRGAIRADRPPQSPGRSARARRS
jgi:hypothetical protein